MEVFLSSKVKLLPLPRSKISWIKTLPPSQQQPTFDNRPKVTAKTLILTSENELRYFELDLHKKNEIMGLKVENEWTHSFDNEDSLEILHFDSEPPELSESGEEKLLLITKEASGLGFYTKSNSTGPNLVKKGVDIRFSNTFDDTPRNFKDHFVMGQIWCGLNFDNDLEYNEKDKGRSFFNCAKGDPRVGAIFHDPKGNSISFYFLHTSNILDAQPARGGEESLFPLEKIEVQLPAEVEQDVEKIWTVSVHFSHVGHPPKNSNGEIETNLNDVIIFQKEGQLFLFQLNESSQLIKVGDLKLPVGLDLDFDFPGMENEDQLTVSSLNFFFSSSVLNLAVNFKSTTVIFSLDEETRQFQRSSFFYFDKGQTPLFFEGQQQMKKKTRNKKQHQHQQLFFLLNGPKGLHYSTHTLDFRPTSAEAENPEMNLPYLKVIATASLAFSKENEPLLPPILFYEHQNAIFAAPFAMQQTPGKILVQENQGISKDIQLQLDHLLVGDCVDEDCLSSSMSSKSLSLLTSDSSSGSENASPVQKLLKYTRKNLWDKSILDLIPVKQIVESAALPTGQIQFNLPLIPLIGFSVSYASNSDSDSNQFGSSSFSVLGHEDWKISSHPFVVRVRKSVFEKLDKFYLILDSQPHPLTLKPTSSSSSQISEFTASTASQYTKILYYSSSSESSNSVGKSYWEFESEGATAFFGQKPDAPVPTDNALRFQYDARMRNWAGGSTTSKFPVEWHLTRLVNRAIGQSFDYKYHPFTSRPTPADLRSKWNRVEPQALFISNVTSISHQNGVSDSEMLKLQFNYGTVNTDERSPFLLNGYSMTTESYQQIVEFKYEANPNPAATVRKLNGIRQQFGSSSTDMIKFSYSKHSESFRPFESAFDLKNPTSAKQTIELLSKVEFPSLKTNVQFTFCRPEGLQLPRRSEATITGTGRNKDAVAGTSGFGFSVVTLDNFLHFYKHSDGSVQTVKFAEASEIPHIENVKVVLSSENAFVQLRATSQVKVQAYSFRVDSIETEGDSNWQKVEEETFSRSSSSSRVILSHDGTIFHVGGQNITIHEWKKSADTRSSPNRPPSYSWKSSSFLTSRPPKGLQLQGNFLSWMEIPAGGSGTQFKYLPYREKGGWNSSNIKSYSISPVREDCFSFFSRYLSLSQKDLDNLWDFFHPALAPIETNLVVFPSCKIKSDGQTVETIADFLVLNKDEAVQNYNAYAVSQETVQNAKNPVNWPTYNVVLAPQNTILIGSKARIFWNVNSNQWSLVQENLQKLDSIDMKLNEDELKLQKSGSVDNLKIKQGAQNQVVEDLGIKNTGQLINFFPDYMVTLSGENNSSRFHLLEFPSRDKTIVKEMRIEGESILPALTKPQILGTLIQPSSSPRSSSNSSIQIRLRTMAFRPQAILTQVKVDGGKYLNRTTGYDYSDAQVLDHGRLIFGMRKVIPGAQHNVTGWMEYKNSFPGNPEIFDSQGNFIGRMQQNLVNQEASADTDLHTLLDMTGTQLILDTRPYLSSDCQVGYYGFQEYEKKKAGEHCKEWDFPEQAVISNDFPLTGRRFLHLEKTDQSLSTSFLLDVESGEDYTISAWVRSSLIKLEDSISPILKAKIQGMEKLTWLSKILLEEDGWHLLQINILSHELDAYKKALYCESSNSNLTLASRPTIGQELEVTITISGQKGSIVDVDHILYAPSGWNSEISVFDPSTLRVTDRILGRSGLLSHNKFDAFGKPLAQINSEGSVMHHEIRAPSPQGTNNNNTDGLLSTAKFEVQGAAGWYESCDPSLQQSLSLQNRNRWQLSPGFAHHIVNSEENGENGLLFKIRDQESFLFRFNYDIDIPSFSNLTAPGAGVILQYKTLDFLSIGKSSQNNTVKLTFGTSLFSGGSNSNPATLEIPPTSSISFVIIERGRVLVWIGDELQLDAQFTPATTQSIVETEWKNLLAIKVSSQASISIGDILILPNPKVTMTYSNVLGEKIQEIEVMSKGQVRVGQLLYDDLGRSVAVTKPTVVDVSSNAPLLSFRSSFVSRFDRERPAPGQNQNQTMQIEGEVSRLNPKDGGFPFTMVKYEPSSFFETVSVEGRPGVDFSIGGRFQKVYQNENSHEFIRILFPENEGFQYRVSKTMNSGNFYEEVTVYKKGLDGSEQTHASVLISQTGKNLLATYDYDERGNLVASHSPEFHKQFKTVLKIESWENLQNAISATENPQNATENPQNATESPQNATESPQNATENPQNATVNPQDPQNATENPHELATFYNYDDWNRLVQKSSPDMGIVNIIYEPTSDKIKYTVHRTRENPEEIKSIMYYEYENEGGSLSEIGILEGFNPATSAEQSENQYESWSYLSSLVKIPKRVIKPQENSELASIFFKTDLVLSSFEVNEGNSAAKTPIFEDYIELVDTKITTMNVVTRTVVFPTKRGIPALLVPTSFQYNAQAEKIVRINLPFQDYGILYRYDMLGQLSSISLSVPNSLPVSSSVRGLIPGIIEIANFEYDGSGAVTQERLHGFNKKSSLNTKISYNSPGFPTERQNAFMKESLSYEDDGYGDRSTGEPFFMMTSTTTQLWENPEAQFHSDASDFVESGVSLKIASFCYGKLEEFGYIENETVVKMLHPKMDHRLPVVCISGSSGQQIQKVFTEKVLKTKSLSVSFKYQYGTHRDLVKVKFVVEQNEDNRTGNEVFCSKPLTPENFLEQLQLELKNSQIEGDEASLKQIWDRLGNSNFLLRAAENSLFAQTHWKPGKSIFNRFLLNTMLKDNVLDFEVVTLMMQHLASVVGVQIREDSDKNLKQVWKLWQPENQQIEQKARTLVRNLIDGGFLSRLQGQIIQVNPSVFHPEFSAAFDSDFSAILKGLVYKTLLSFFNCAIGSSPLDKEVLETDSNGNFKLFYNGHDRVELNYVEGTNGIRSMNVTSNKPPQKLYKITHDHFGNLNSAPHHKIDSINYDEIAGKPILMRLTNGSFLKFRYDLRGERVTKEVFGPNGALVKKIKYLSRDEHGRSLLEEEFTFVSPDIPPKTRTTLYIYNPDRTKGLVGFIRGGKLYNVFTDNINSVRLVILDGHVVGAWDYHPYGNTINEYITHEDASILYRFSGQELDEETGLYNFHARIYDPFLGRFYQIDPEEQFFSPYKYAGNSPLNSIDPDGRKIFSRILGTTSASLGAYMGGSAANNNWDPAKWKWGRLGAFPQTEGRGPFVPLLTSAQGTAGTSLSVGSLGTGNAYLLATSANKEWNPRRWDVKSPGTFDALFLGIAMGVALRSGVSSYGALVNALSKPGQVLIDGATLTSNIGMGYVSSVADNSNTASRANFGAPASSGFQNVAREIMDFLGAKRLAGASVSSSSSPMFYTKGASAAPKILGLSTPAGLNGYVTVSAANDAWILADWANAGTYAALVNGMWSGASGSLIATGEGGQYLRKQITTTQDNGSPWFRTAASPLRIKFQILTARLGEMQKTQNRSPGSRENSDQVQVQPQAGQNTLAPTLKLTRLGNSKWVVLGFSGQGKGGIVYQTLNPTAGSNSSSNLPNSTSHTFSERYRDRNVQVMIEKENKKLQKVLPLFSQKKDFLEHLKKNLGAGAGNEKECKGKCMLIATVLEELTRTKLRDGTFVSSGEWELLVLSVIEWVEKKFEVKSLLQQLEEQYKVPNLGDDLLSAQLRLVELQLENPGEEKSKYAAMSNYIKHDILKAVEKSMDKNQGLYKEGARSVASWIRKLIVENNYKAILGNWDASNCGKAVVQSAMIKAREILQLDNDNPNGVRVEGIDYYAIYNPWTMKKTSPSRCSQCLFTSLKDNFNVGVGLFRFVVTRKKWLSKIEQVDHAFFFFQGGPQANKTNAELPVYDYDEDEDGFHQVDKPRISRSVENPLQVEMGNFIGPRVQLLKRDASSGFASSAASASFHGGIIQSLHKTIKNILSKPFEMEMDFGFDFGSPFWTTGKELQEKSSFVHEEREKSIFHPQISNKKKAEENGGDKAFSTRCLPFYTKGGDEFADAIDILGLSCFSAHGQMMVFYPDPREQMLPPLISGQSSASSSSSSWNMNNQLHSFDKESCQFLSSFHGQPAAFCQGSKSNILYMPNPPAQKPLDSLNDQLLLLLLAQHFLQNSGWFGFKTRDDDDLCSPETESTETGKSESEEDVLSPDELNSFESIFKAELQNVKEKRERLILQLQLQLKTQQEKERGFKNRGSFLHFCHFDIEDLEEEFSQDIEKSKLGGFSSQQKMEYLDRLTEIEVEMQEDFETLSEFGMKRAKVNADFSSERKSGNGNGNSLWNFAEGLFYTFHHKSQ